MKNSHSRTPKQNRSRESFDRVLAAAADLLQRGGVQAITLTEVSRRSKVSIGSIYCRVDGKKDLLRAVQERVLDEMDKEFSGVVNKLRRRAMPLKDLIPALVKEQAEFLERHLLLLNAFIEQARKDPVIGVVGRKHYSQAALDFKLLLLERHSEFTHPDPERAAAVSFEIVYGTLARTIGLGERRDVGGVAASGVRQLIEDLGQVLVVFLTTNPGKPARA